MNETEDILKKSAQLILIKTGEEPEPPEENVDSTLLLDLIEKRRQQRENLSPQDAAFFERVNLTWNMDGTLSTLQVNQGERTFKLTFIWNADGTLSSIRRTP